MEKLSVLFVCTANICRSPMAAALFRQYLKNTQSDWENWRVESAGTWGYDGEPASGHAVKIMAERGEDISGHRSQIVTAELLNQFDLILTMEPGHKEALMVEFLQVWDRVFLLSEMSGERKAVKDPYGSRASEYRKTVATLENMIIKGMEQIVRLVRSRHNA